VAIWEAAGAPGGRPESKGEIAGIILARGIVDIVLLISVIKPWEFMERRILSL
jgi:hypothetical protein